MKRISWILITVVLLFTAVVPAYAAPGDDRLPPLPEWPIIGPLLELLGVSTPESETPPAPTPDPALPEQRITNVDEAVEFWRGLESGERVRVLVADDDVNAELRTFLADVPAVRTATVTFNEGSATVSVDVNTQAVRELLEEQNIQLPFFIRQNSLGGEFTIAVEAENCRPLFTIGGRRLSLRRRFLQELADQWLYDYWPEEGCIEEIILTPGEMAVEGYR